MATERDAEHEQALNDRDWWKRAGEVLGLTLHGWNYRTIARFEDEEGASVNLTGAVAKRLHALPSPPESQP